MQRFILFFAMPVLMISHAFASDKFCMKRLFTVRFVQMRFIMKKRQLSCLVGCG